MKGVKVFQGQAGETTASPLSDRHPALGPRAEISRDNWKSYAALSWSAVGISARHTWLHCAVGQKGKLRHYETGRRGPHR